MVQVESVWLPHAFSRARQEELYRRYQGVRLELLAELADVRRKLVAFFSFAWSIRMLVAIVLERRMLQSPTPGSA